MPNSSFRFNLQLFVILSTILYVIVTLFLISILFSILFLNLKYVLVLQRNIFYHPYQLFFEIIDFKFELMA